MWLELPMNQFASTKPTYKKDIFETKKVDIFDILWKQNLRAKIISPPATTPRKHLTSGLYAAISIPWNPTLNSKFLIKEFLASIFGGTILPFFSVKLKKESRTLLISTDMRSWILTGVKTIKIECTTRSEAENQKINKYLLTWKINMFDNMLGLIEFLRKPIWRFPSTLWMVFGWVLVNLTVKVVGGNWNFVFSMFVLRSDADIFFLDWGLFGVLLLFFLLSFCGVLFFGVCWDFSGSEASFDSNDILQRRWKSSSKVGNVKSVKSIKKKPVLNQNQGHQQLRWRSSENKCCDPRYRIIKTNLNHILVEISS